MTKISHISRGGYDKGFYGIRATNFDDSMSSDESDMNGFNLSMIDKTIGTSVLQSIRK